MQGMAQIRTFHLGSTEILSLGLGTLGPEGLQNSNIQNTRALGPSGKETLGVLWPWTEI